MKKLMLMVFLPVALFALERVNLIKDAGFEKNSEVWDSYTCKDSAIANPNDSEKAFSDLYSGSLDDRRASYPDYDSAVIIQGFINKHVSDIESLYVNFAVTPLGDDFSDSLVAAIFFGLHINVGETNFRVPGYKFKPADIPPLTPLPLPWYYLEERNFFPDTLWHDYNRNVQNDLLNASITIPMEASVDSFVLIGWGVNRPPWRGQKVYFDDIRLTGYADYDVGVKSILSGDSVWKSTAYMPTARIKNFGRKAADSFLVIAKIDKGSTPVYADTLTWSLAADTEDTVSFKEFIPDSANYTLTISTVMTPDESDEDDVMSKTLYGSGITETPSPSSLQLEVVALSSIRYSIPAGEQGTITLYDPAGRRIESLHVQGEGQVSLRSNLSSGVYFVKLEAGKAAVTKKAVVLR